MATSSSDKPSQEEPPLTERISSWCSLFAKATSILRVAVPLLLLFRDSAPIGDYATDIGGQLTLHLEGVELTLNTNTRVSLHPTKTGLSIRIFQGEVLFRIEHRAGRCIEVWADNTLTSDVGTTFDVYLAPDRVMVTVIDGTLHLSKLDAEKRSPSDGDFAGLTLRGGDRGEVRRNSPTRRPTTQKLEMRRILSDIAWEHGDLSFDSTSLQDIVQQFNRYNRTPQIEIQDPRSHL